VSITFLNNEDRDKLREKLKTCINPLDPQTNSTCITNIVSGIVGTDAVNVDEAVAIGRQQMNDFKSSWPGCFNASLSKKVITMAVVKKNIRLGSLVLFDTNLIYSRVMGLLHSRDISLQSVLHHELAPVPTSMFEDSGEMRIAKTKSVLKRKIQVDVSARLSQPEVVIIDACAILWIIHWPTNGTVSDFVDSFSTDVFRKLQHSDVNVVFDRYNDYSIKSGTRSSRAGQASRCYILGLHTPLPSQHVTLSVKENKTQLIDLICKGLLDKAANYTTASHKLVVTECDAVPVMVSEGVVTEREDLTTTHEEADVIMVQHVIRMADSTQKMKVICDVTDVFILLVHYYTMLSLTCQLTMEDTSPKRAVVDIGETAKKHAQIAPYLLAAHCLTGCDTVAHLCGIGKTTVVKVLLAGHTLTIIGSSNANEDDILEEATAFIAACYGIQNKGTMSQARYLDKEDGQTQSDFTTDTEHTTAHH
jgi:hypothetical protein